MPPYEKRASPSLDNVILCDKGFARSATPAALSPHTNVEGMNQSQEKLNAAVGLNALADEDIFPDGGQGWMVVTGAFFALISTFGLVNSWVFQSYYQTDVLPHVNPSAIAWIGSVQYSLVFMPGLISGRLFDIGWFHAPLLIASTLLVLATLLVAECAQFWQFMLTQGIVTGMACGFTFGLSIPVVSHWFKAKRATAYGIVASGASVGGTLFPITVRRLIPIIGFKWTMRVLALILLVSLGVSNLLLRRRIPPKTVSKGLISLKAFKSVPYALYALSCFTGFLGVYTMLTYIDIAAISFGISPEFSFYLVALVNTGSLFGRISSGVLSDKVGCLNVLIPSTVATAVVTFAWPFCHSRTSLIILAIIYGITSGAFITLIASAVANLGDTSDVGNRVGMILTICSLGSLCGPPISGAILSAYGGYINVGIYAGVMILTSACVMFATRWQALGGIRGKL